MRRPWSAARWDRVDGPLPPRHQPRGRRSGRPIGTPRTALSLSEVGSPNRHVCAGPMRTRDRDTPDTPPRPQPTRPRGIPSTDPHLATELSDRSPLFYAEIYHDLRARGRVLSQVNMLLVALARSMKATVLTSDRDFEALPELRVENWLK